MPFLREGRTAIGENNMPRKKKKQSRKYIPMNEFRYADSKIYGDHPQYVFGKTRSGKFKTLGLTTSPDDKHPVIPLSKNPNPKDDRKSYIGTKPHTLRESELDKIPKRNWEFASKDKPVIRHLIKNYKKRSNRKPKNWYEMKRRRYKKKK